MNLRIANAPVSWGIYEFEGVEPRFSPSMVLDQIRETGYEGIELGPWGFLPTEPGALRAELASRGLALLSSFVPVRLVDPESHRAAEEHALTVGRLLAACGARFLVLADDNGSVPELAGRAGRRSGVLLTDGEWRLVARGVERIARRARDELGLTTVFHHHCAGYVETPEETAELLARTDAELVGLCLDTGHWHYAGGDALDALREYGERVRYVHLKDCSGPIATRCRDREYGYHRAVQEGVFCPLGKGDVDFSALLKALEELGYSGWAVVEQDILTDDPEAPRRHADENRAYLRSLGV